MDLIRKHIGNIIEDWWCVNVDASRLGEPNAI